MKKSLVSILTALASLTIAMTPAFADLGDTYAQSCAKYGGRGTVYRVNHQIVWHVSKHSIAETFIKNECVAMMLVPDRGLLYSTDDFARIAPDEAGRGQTWVGSPDAPLEMNVAEWNTTDNLVLAVLGKDGRIQFSYTWWSRGKGLLKESPGYGTAPVEDQI